MFGRRDISPKNRETTGYSGRYIIIRSQSSYNRWQRGGRLVPRNKKALIGG